MPKGKKSSTATPSSASSFTMSSPASFSGGSTFSSCHGKKATASSSNSTHGNAAGSTHGVNSSSAVVANRTVNAIPLNGPCVICSEPSRFRCSCCKVRLYCSATHQEVDWREHQKECYTQRLSFTRSNDDFNLYDQCNHCTSIEKGILTRVLGWEFLCDSCYSSADCYYFPAQQDSLHQTNYLYPKLSTVLTNKKTQKTCVHCGSQSFLILRDELLDEWLVCVACEQTKQMIRCWNAYKKSYVNCVDTPLVHYNDADEIDEDSLTLNTIGDTDSMSDDDAGDELDMPSKGRNSSSSRDIDSLSIVDKKDRSEVIPSDMSSTEFFSQFVVKDSPVYQFRWIDDAVPKERTEVTYSDVNQLSDDVLKRVLTDCGVARRDVDLLFRTELVTVYNYIAAGIKDIKLIFRLANIPTEIGVVGKRPSLKLVEDVENKEVV